RAQARAPPGDARAGRALRGLAAALGDVRGQLRDPARHQSRRDVAARPASAPRTCRRAGDRRRPDPVNAARAPGVRAAPDARRRVPPRALVLLAGAARRRALEPDTSPQTGPAAGVGGPRHLHGYLFTVLGIAIGVAGLVSLGAMSERIVRFIEGGDRFVLGQISAAGRGMGMGTGFTAGGILPAATIRAISDVPGVQGVQAQIMLPLDPSTSQFMTVTQELVLGMDLSVPSPNRSYPTLPLRSGRFLRPGDRKVAVVGASFAASRSLGVGSHITLEDEDYEVVGVL